MNALLPVLAVTLAGQWRFQIDPEDLGVQEQWYEQSLSDRVELPGTLTGQGIGDDITTDTRWVGQVQDPSFFSAPECAKYREPGKVKIPFWLQPETYYAGSAWYQRDIEISADEADRRTVLFLERAHWETRLWVDGAYIGADRSLSTPHEYGLGQLAPGSHTLTLRVDNRSIVDIGENSHGISDHTQGNWNGIVGKIELRTTPLVWIEDVQVYPGRVRVEVGNATGKPGSGELVLGSRPQAVEWGDEGATLVIEVPPADGVAPWDEFSPSLVHFAIQLKSEFGEDQRNLSVGLRDVSTDGTQFTINGRKMFLRGTLECAIFPRTGHPPMEIEEWRRIMRVAQSYGLNHLRFHSWCPPDAAFQSADELGMYLQVETCWPNQSTTIGDGKPVDEWVYEETDRILKAYGNHPSFVLMAPGNEPAGKKRDAYLTGYVEHYAAQDPRRLWTSGSGWPELAVSEFHVSPAPRIQQWGQGLTSRINAAPPETTTDYRTYMQERNVPVVSHEIGQWCVYPNFEEMPKYTGYLKPKNFEIFRDRLDSNAMGGLARSFLIASGKLQTLCYKEEIEAALRTPGMGGFQLLDLHDFPGQGTALVGVLDPFWEEKGYVTAAQYNRFCNVTVPLARLPRRVFTTGDRLEAEVEIAHFGAKPLTNAVVEWRLVQEDGTTLVDGVFPAHLIPVDNAIPVGRVDVDLRQAQAPGRNTLVVGLRGTDVENDWDLWVYPESPDVEPASGVLVTAQFNESAQARLQSGETVLLTIPGGQVRNFDTAPVKLGFSSIFWNTAWTHRQAPTTLGILCDPEHPALAAFPTEFHSNWQWWHLIRRAGALRLDQLPSEVEPIVRVIDDWVTARPLGLVVEGRVGAGRIVICGFDLTHDADDPVSRQLRASLLHYMASPRFKPAVALHSEQIESLVAKEASNGL